METHLELTAPDRARIDALVCQLDRYNAQFDTDVIVSCIEAARLLKRTPPTISVWIREGRLHKVTIGQSSGILLSEIRNIQNSQ